MHDELLSVQQGAISSFVEELVQKISANSLSAQHLMRQEANVRSKSTVESVEEITIKKKCLKVPCTGTDITGIYGYC